MGECPVYDGKPGAVIIVGCHGDSDDGSGSGSAYLYRWIDDAIQAPRKLKAEDAGSGDAFGSAIGLIDNSGDAIALVSAPFWDQPSYTNIGAIYAFDGVSGQATEELDYDADGNLTDDGEMLYFYDAENRLIQIKPKAPELGDFRVSFTYDYMGRRVRKVTEVWCDGVSSDSPCDGQPEGWVADPNGDIRFIYDGWNVVMERRFNGTTEDVVHKFAWGADLSGLNGAAASGSASDAVHGAGGIGGLLAVEEHDPGYVFTEPAKYLYFYDGNGNVGQVVTLDIGVFGEQPGVPPSNEGWYPAVLLGQIAARYEYDPYGGTLVASQDGWMTNPFRFSTKYYDAQPATAAAGERGLYYYGYRYYSPRMGRWVNRDPICEAGGLLLYKMCENNTFGVVDPRGWQPTSQPAGTFKTRIPICCLLNKAGLIDESDIYKQTPGYLEGLAQKGQLFTCRCGILDMGHVEGAINEVRANYEALLRSRDKGFKFRLESAQTNAQLLETIPPDELTKLAASVSWDSTLIHEIQSLSLSLPGGDNSAFSPEDLPSNMVGIIVGLRAISKKKFRENWEQSKLEELKKVLHDCKPIGRVAAGKAWDEHIQDKWVEGSGFGMKLLKRNFSHIPMLVKCEGCSDEETVPKWLSSGVPLLRDKYSVRIGTYNASSERIEFHDNFDISKWMHEHE